MAIPSDMVVQRSSKLDESTDESKEVVRAITRGEVDAFVISSGDTEEVVLLGAADRTYRHLIDKMHQGTVNINRDGIILFANKQFAAMIGVPGSELIGSALDQYVLPESRAGLISLLEDGRARRKRSHSFAAMTRPSPRKCPRNSCRARRSSFV
jgi:PAS domain-containing protein